MVKSLRTGSYGTPEYSGGDVSIENLKTGSGVLIRVTVTQKAAGTIIFYDATTGTSGTIASLDTTNFEGTFELGIQFTTGLRWVKTGNAKATIIYV
jgi:hypothetical protein